MRAYGFPGYCGGNVLVGWTKRSIKNTKTTIKEAIDRSTAGNMSFSAVLTQGQMNNILGRGQRQVQLDKFKKHFGMDFIKVHKNPNTRRICYYFIGDKESIMKAIGDENEI